MCGIAGYISAAEKPLQPTLAAMARAIAHRGPDGEAFYLHPGRHWGLAHRRLSIIDTSAAGAQPMYYRNTVLVYNGEIYNYQRLKAGLQARGHTFISNTDSEIIPALFLEYGLASFDMLDGMFAFALYLQDSDELYLVRDRLGEKPLYYHARYEQRGQFAQFLFASEMKALWAAGAPRQPRPNALLNYLALGMVQNPLNKTDTFFQDILSLPPGHYLRIQPAACKVQMRRWHRPEQLRTQPAFAGNEAQMITGLRNHLLQSVALRLRSDVPLGASLSGGIDSSAIAAAILQQHPQLTGFSALFPGFAQDESLHVNALKAHLGQGLHLHTVMPTPEMLAAQLPALLHHQEEPLQSASVFTQYCVYQLASSTGVKVLLDGQGADEVLGGYRRYMHYHLMDLFLKQPGQVWKERKLLAERGLLQKGTFKTMQAFLAGKYPKRAAIALQNRAFKQLLNTPGMHPDFVYNHRNYDALQKPVVQSLDDLLHHQTFYVGLQELLRYADRNSMAHGAEVRLPFLAPGLVQWLFSLPYGKVHAGWNKWLLRKAAEPWLPAELAWRHGKVGYEPPQALWMQHALIKQQVTMAREKLVEAKVMLPQVLQMPIQDAGAHSGQNAAWRQICAAYLLA